MNEQCDYLNETGAPIMVMYDKEYRTERQCNEHMVRVT